MEWIRVRSRLRLGERRGQPLDLIVSVVKGCLRAGRLMGLVMAMNDVRPIVLVDAAEMHVLLRHERRRQQTQCREYPDRLVSDGASHREDYWRCESPESNLRVAVLGRV